MSTVFNDVAGGKPLTIARRHDRRADQREPYLATVGVSRQRESNVGRYLGKHIWVVGQYNQRRIRIRHSGQCRFHVVWPRQEVAHSCHPYEARRRDNLESPIFQNLNPLRP